MSRRKKNPDGVLDVDAGAGGGLFGKSAVMIPLSEQASREEQRAGLRDLDRMTERHPGLTRAQRDEARIMPRAAPGEIPWPVMERRLQPLGATRQPVSGRQRDARCKVKNKVLDGIPARDREALFELTTSSETWTRVTRTLQATAGDVDSLDPDDRRFAKRVDRAIQAYEESSDRGHVVYVGVRLPNHVNHANIDRFLEHELQRGDEVAFDRWTGAAHTPYEARAALGADPGGRVMVLEIQTRRGIYLGQSSSGGSTAHVLPRGMQMVVAGPSGRMRYNGPSGTEDVAAVQLVDATPESAQQRRP